MVGLSHGYAIGRMLEGSGRTSCMTHFISSILFIRCFLLSSNTILISLDEPLGDLLMNAVDNPWKWLINEDFIFLGYSKI